VRWSIAKTMAKPTSTAKKIVMARRIFTIFIAGAKSSA
jgi:hypothetical protein